MEDRRKLSNFKMDAQDGDNALVKAVAGENEDQAQFTFTAADGGIKLPKRCDITFRANLTGIRMLPQLERPYDFCQKFNQCTRVLSSSSSRVRLGRQ
jgi:hypothetical protein